MAVTIFQPEDYDNQSVYTGDAGLSPLPVTVTTYGFKTVKDAIEDKDIKNAYLKHWKDMVGVLEAGSYVGTQEAARDVMSAIMDHPKIILEHKDYTGVRINPYLKEVQAIKLPFPKITILTADALSLEIIKKTFKLKEGQTLDTGNGDLNAFRCFYATQQEDSILITIPLIDKKTRLHLLEVMTTYGETPTGEVRILSTAEPRQTTWIKSDILNDYVRRVIEVIYMMTLNPATTQAYVSIPTDKEVAVNKKRLRNNKKPMIEFKLITIDGKKRDPIPALPTGTHAPPRQHWRRGHWRHYSSGKTVFINPMLVGDEKNGKIIKDYAIGNYEDRGHERGRSTDPQSHGYAPGGV